MAQKTQTHNKRYADECVCGINAYDRRAVFVVCKRRRGAVRLDPLPVMERIEGILFIAPAAAAAGATGAGGGGAPTVGWGNVPRRPLRVAALKTSKQRQNTN